MTDPAPPIGFDLLAAGLVVYVLAGTWFVGATPPAGELGSLPAIVQVTSVVLAAVAIEALWKVRPWVTRAAAALAATILVQVAALAISLRFLLGTAAVLLLIVGYVHLHAGRILGARVGVPAARRP